MRKLSKIRWVSVAAVFILGFSLASTSVFFAPANTTFVATAAAAEEDDVDTNQDLCDAKLYSPLTWVLCPTIDIMHKATDAMQKMINKLMLVDATGIFDRSTASGQSYYTAWNSFRVFGIALIIIAGLIMVASQAFGFEIFDAYAVKRMLPRLVVAIIGISLSWWLMWFLVNLTNDLGIGIRRFIYAPFQGLITDGGFAGLDDLGSRLIGNLAIGGALVFLQWGGILSLLATVGLAVLIAFAVLIIRQVIITFLILIAPLAIACYVLPNTEKAYKLWWDSLSKGLLMFPIISAFIAAGAVFSIVAQSNESTDFGMSSVVATLAYFLPYFAIPFTFRLAGGAIATLGGLANDRSRGAFDRLRNYRAQKAGYNFKRLQNQTRWDNSSKIGRAANKVGTWVTDPGSNAQYELGKRNVVGFKKSGAKIAGQIEHAQVEQSRKLFEEINAMGFNDKGFRALNSGLWSKSMRTRFAEAGVKDSPRSLSDLDKIAHVLSQSDDQTERTAGQAIEANRGRLATLYQDPDMSRATLSAAGLMGLAAHGFMNRKDLAAGANVLVGEGGAGFARAVGTQAQLAGVRSRPEIKAGYGLDYKDGKFVDGLTDNDGLRAYNLVETLNPSDYAGAKSGTFKQDGTGIGDTLAEILRIGKGPDAERAAALDREELKRRINQAVPADATPEERQRIEGDKRAAIIDMKLAIAHSQYDSVLDGMLQNTSFYAHGSNDTKTEIKNVLRAAGLDPDTEARRRQGTIDPRSVEAQAQAQAAEQQAQQQGPGGN